MRAVGLFAGIGGIELGLHSAGYETTLLCEIDEAAQAILGARFDAPCVPDVLELEELPESELCGAGFPCQDLSQAGRTAGIKGSNSGLVSKVFELLARHRDRPRWVLLENVPFMLRLDRGDAIQRRAVGVGGIIPGVGRRWRSIVHSQMRRAPLRQRKDGFEVLGSRAIALTRLVVLGLRRVIA